MKKYVISDLHGRLNLFKEIHNKLEKEDILYILGDTIDRGSFEGTMEIYKICMSDPRIIHLLGNHEDMCLSIFKSIMIEHNLHGQNAMYMLNFSDFEYQLWDCNGGRDFINALIDGRFKIDKLIELYLYIKSMPLILNEEGYKLSHAGVNELGIKDREFVLWNIKHEELLKTKQVVGHLFHDCGVKKIDDIIYIDTSNFKNKLGVFELIEEKLFEIEIKED